MLRELHIKNIAVIDEVYIDFSKGFNALTGETGAGKSILIDSINMALGNRTSHDIIRHGCDFASVSVCFEIESSKLCEKLSELGVETEDNMVIISRRLGNDGKSSYRINGAISPGATVREVASLLIDIHGQSDNQSLLNNKNHLGLLDEYGQIGELKEKFGESYDELSAIDREIKSLSQNEEEKLRRLELIKFQIDEIQGAKLKKGEDEELEILRDKLYNMESIVSGAGIAYGALYGGEEGTVYDLLRQAERALSDICRFDPKLDESYERLSGLIAETEDIASEINSCLSKTDFSMAELDSIEDRLNTIGNLKRKYGNSIEEIQDFLETISKEAQTIENSDERIEELKTLRKTVFDKVQVLAAELSKLRKAAAEKLETEIATELSFLDMPKVKFAISLSEREDENGTLYTKTGKDIAEFMISTNPGEELKPISKIASGGELSRIMLGVKSVLSATDDADTMIFDEIDTGVSGRAAQKIAEKICTLSRGKQIFAITHLAQIASMADSHYLIEKAQDDSVTKTTVRLLEKEERVEELARILGGVSVTDLTRQSALEMLDMAEEKKRLAK